MGGCSKVKLQKTDDRCTAIFPLISVVVTDTFARSGQNLARTLSESWPRNCCEAITL